MRIQARQLLSFTTDQLEEILTGNFSLVFEDGVEIETNARETIYSSYFWEFHREYPLTPILSNHHLKSVIKNSKLNSNTHIKLVGNVFWTVIDTYNIKDQYKKFELIKKIYQLTNDLYNAYIIKAQEYVVSIDILDFINVVSHNEINDVIKNADSSQQGIETAYKRITNVLENDLNISDNAVIKAYRAGMVNKNQVMQCIGPPGFITEVDGTIMPEPVMRSYTQGLRTVYNLSAESRKAAKALHFSEAPLQDAEYFARRLQLICMVVEKLVRNDCGSTKYLHWKLNPPVYERGSQVYAGDLKYMVGKWYLDEETQTLKVLTIDDKHLYGKTIKLRSGIYCQEKNKHHICEVCFGKLADNIGPHANIGHISSATMTKQTSQSVLSTKHLITSSTSEPITLVGVAKKFFTVGPKGNTYHLVKDLKNRKPVLILSKEEVFGLTDILLVDDVREVSPGRVSKIDLVKIEADGINEIDTILTISQNDRKAMLTTEMLEYIKQKSWTISPEGHFVFDMSDFGSEKPVFKLPEKEYDYSQHSHQIAKLIESRMKDISERAKPESPATTLVELFELVNTKLEVDLSLLEVIIYAMTISGTNSYDYNLGRNSPTQSLGIRDGIIGSRSLSAAYAFEKQTNTIHNPRAFFPLNRPNSPFDVFISPKETLTDTSRYS